MKKLLKKYRAMTPRDDFPKTGRHIRLLRIRAFAIEGIAFTEKEDAHFDACRVCRLQLIDVLKNLTPQVRPHMPKAA